MNKKKWREAPLAHLVTKLAEECGEVAKAMNDARYANSRVEHHRHLQEVVMECDHVTFIAEQTKEAALAIVTTRFSPGA